MLVPGKHRWSCRWWLYLQTREALLLHTVLPYIAAIISCILQSEIHGHRVMNLQMYLVPDAMTELWNMFKSYLFVHRATWYYRHLWKTVQLKLLLNPLNENRTNREPNYLRFKTWMLYWLRSKNICASEYWWFFGELPQNRGISRIHAQNRTRETVLSILTLIFTFRMHIL